MALNSSITHQVGDAYRSVVSFFSSSEGKSKFESAGTLTSAEFVTAGDQLVFQFPTWQWQPAKKGLEKNYLPADKQFLITKNVPCLSRVRDLDTVIFNKIKDGEDGDDWNVAEDNEDNSTNHPEPQDNKDTEAAVPNATQSAPQIVEDYAGGLAGLDAELGASEDHAVVVRKDHEDPKKRIRSYDLSITWDKYYQTPRLWLFGYNAQGQPLSDVEVCEDILSDYTAKTVTVDPHPCTGLKTVSIHPCQHAKMMLKVVNEWKAKNHPVRPDLSIFVFLKFISSVVPTINYDFTMDIDM